MLVQVPMVVLYGFVELGVILRRAWHCTAGNIRVNGLADGLEIIVEVGGGVAA